MKLIIDTNVFVSGIFFSGPPYTILSAWRNGKISLLISPEILDEYQRTGEKLSNKFPGVDLEHWITLIMLKASVIDAPLLKKKVCIDPDDDKFLALAIASNTKIITSGDKHLLDVTGYHGISVLKPREFVDEYLSWNDNI